MTLKMRLVLYCMLIIGVVLFQVACERPERDSSDKKPIKESNTFTPSDSVKIDIFIDGTLSMLGYISKPQSRYLKFLDEVKSTAEFSWKSCQIQYLKFGTTYRKLRQNEIGAYRTRNFYHERGIYERTKIEKVIEQASADKLTLIVTDLFQDEGDINSVTKLLKDHCLAQGINVGILAIASEFDGRVYDTGYKQAPYSLKTVDNDETTYRPFYTLVLGDYNNIGFLIQSLAKQDYIVKEKFLLLSQNIVDSYEIQVVKDRNSRAVQALARKKNDDPNTFNFRLKKGENSGILNCTVKPHKRAFAPDADESGLEIVVLKKSLGANIEESDAIKLEETPSRGDGDAINFNIHLRLPEAPSLYTYSVTLKAGRVGGLLAPEWISELSTTHPSQTTDANKTLNLEKFVYDLFRASLANNQPNIATFTLNIDKK